MSIKKMKLINIQDTIIILPSAMNEVTIKQYNKKDKEVVKSKLKGRRATQTANCLIIIIQRES